MRLLQPRPRAGLCLLALPACECKNELSGTISNVCRQCEVRRTAPQGMGVLELADCALLVREEARTGMCKACGRVCILVRLTLAPSRANARAHASPMPRAAPVTTATRPCRRIAAAAGYEESSKVVYGGGAGERGRRKWAACTLTRAADADRTRIELAVRL